MKTWDFVIVCLSLIVYICIVYFVYVYFESPFFCITGKIKEYIFFDFKDILKHLNII